MLEQRKAEPSTLQLVAAFAAIYLLWGSTYLFIKFGVETIPPFLMAGARHLLAGSLLFAWLGLRGGMEPMRPAQWAAAAIVGALLLVGGNGSVSWAEQRVPSGLAALLVATVPLWIVLLEWLRPGLRSSGARPCWGAALGLLLGFGGVGLLVGPSKFNHRVDPLGAAVLVLASLSWAIGSLYSRSHKVPIAPLQAAAMQSLAGGGILFALSAASGEWARLDPAQVSLRSVLSLLYLVLFGSLLGFTAYIWLLRVTTASRVSTYAYVNPVVAVLLGWLFAGEAVTPRMIGATALIVVAVALVITQQHKPALQASSQSLPASTTECAD
jgi:drug/metabolite transporter (DMT)-like permease